MSDITYIQQPQGGRMHSKLLCMTQGSSQCLSTKSLFCTRYRDGRSMSPHALTPEMWSLSTTQETTLNAQELQDLLGAVWEKEWERLPARGCHEWPHRCPHTGSEHRPGCQVENALWVHNCFVFGAWVSAGTSLGGTLEKGFVLWQALPAGRTLWTR